MSQEVSSQEEEIKEYSLGFSAPNRIPKLEKNFSHLVEPPEFPKSLPKRN